MNELWDKYMDSDGPNGPQFTPQGNMKKIPNSVICDWVTEAWNGISEVGIPLSTFFGSMRNQCYEKRHL